MSDLEHFSDETSSGQYQVELRGLFRIDFAARSSLENDFQWYVTLEKDYKKKFGINELKSGLLIELAKESSNLLGYVLSKIYNSTLLLLI
jgi:hypothetical protein